MFDVRERLCLATIDRQAPALTAQYGLGLEIDEFCTAMNMDAPGFADYDARVRPLSGRARVFHAPFSEIYPSASDPKARALARERLEQAWRLARGYGIRHMVAHGGFLPLVYFPEWFVERSADFWRGFLADKPADFRLFLENVLEPEPELLRDVAAAVDDPRLRLCLDLGHAHVQKVSQTPLCRWVEVCAPWLGHVHLHDNDGVWDWHTPLGSGGVPAQALLEQLAAQAPDVTVTLEHPQDSEASLRWLAAHGWLDGHRPCR